MTTYNFPEHKRGTTFRGATFTLTDVNGAISLTGASIKMQARKAADTPVVLEWKTTDGSITVEGVNDNEIVLHEKTAQQMDIEPFRYQYDIKITMPNGEADIYFGGVLPVITSITR